MFRTIFALCAKILNISKGSREDQIAKSVSVLGLGAGIILGARGEAIRSGVNDTEIRIGQTMAYSGPLSALGSIGKVEAAYFAKVNEEGGLNGGRFDSSLLTMGIARLKRWNTPAG